MTQNASTAKQGTRMVSPLHGGDLLLSCTDIADWLGVGTRTWWRWTTCGKGPRPDLHLGRVVRWRRSTIEHWLSEQGMRSDTRQWEG